MAQKEAIISDAAGQEECESSVEKCSLLVLVQAAHLVS